MDPGGVLTEVPVMLAKAGVEGMRMMRVKRRSTSSPRL
jgi:hypothetical protein